MQRPPAQCACTLFGGPTYDKTAVANDERPRAASIGRENGHATLDAVGAGRALAARVFSPPPRTGAVIFRARGMAQPDVVRLRSRFRSQCSMFPTDTGPKKAAVNEESCGTGLTPWAPSAADRLQDAARKTFVGRRPDRAGPGGGPTGYR